VPSSASFVIDKDSGQISFIPYTGTEGTYTVTIIVDDSNSEPVSTSFKLTITKKPSIIGDEFDVSTEKEFKTTIEVLDAIPGQTYTFSDNTDLFDINPTTGEIKFNPKDADEGTHTVLITAIDTNGTTFSTTLTFTIKGEGENIVPLVILLIVVLLAGAVVVFYFFVRPNLDKLDGEEEGEEESVGRPPRPSRKDSDPKDRRGRRKGKNDKDSESEPKSKRKGNKAHKDDIEPEDDLKSKKRGRPKKDPVDQD